MTWKALGKGFEPKLLMIARLGGGSASPRELYAAAQLSRQQGARHLRELVALGLVARHADGRRAVYTLEKLTVTLADAIRAGMGEVHVEVSLRARRRS